MSDQRQSSILGTVIDTYSSIPGGISLIRHKLAHPFAKPYTLIISRDSPAVAGAAKALQQGRIDVWAEMPLEGQLLITVDKKQAPRACQLLGRYGIDVLNPPQPAPAMLPTTGLLAGLTGQQRRGPRQAARQARGRARRPGGLLDRMGF